MSFDEADRLAHQVGWYANERAGRFALFTLDTNLSVVPNGDRDPDWPHVFSDLEDLVEYIRKSD